MKGRTRLAIDQNRPLRHAIEIRNTSFVDASFVELLRKYQVALVVANTAGKWPYCEDVTSNFMYLRLHGDKVLYASGYSEDALDRWAKRISIGSKGGGRMMRNVSMAPHSANRDVYCYFDNDIKVKTPFDARRLIDKLDLSEGLVPFTWQK